MTYVPDILPVTVLNMPPRPARFGIETLDDSIAALMGLISIVQAIRDTLPPLAAPAA